MHSSLDEGVKIPEGPERRDSLRRVVTLPVLPATLATAELLQTEGVGPRPPGTTAAAAVVAGEGGGRPVLGVT